VGVGGGGETNFGFVLPFGRLEVAGHQHARLAHQLVVLAPKLLSRRLPQPPTQLCRPHQVGEEDDRLQARPGPVSLSPDHGTNGRNDGGARP
jgi:hypothetical protein